MDQAGPASLRLWSGTSVTRAYGSWGVVRCTEKREAKPNEERPSFARHFAQRYMAALVSFLKQRPVRTTQRPCGLSRKRRACTSEHSDSRHGGRFAGPSSSPSAMARTTPARRPPPARGPHAARTAPPVRARAELAALAACTARGRLIEANASEQAEAWAEVEK